MKRFLVFFGDKYYPSGGMDDFVSDHVLIEEALDALASKVEASMLNRDIYSFANWELCWGHIYDAASNSRAFDSGDYS
jgi:hypothetical protein